MNQDIKTLQSKISSFCEERDWDKFHTPKNLAISICLEASICRRQGQGEFRRNLLKVYDNKCAITNSTIPETLEAAHIIPYKGSSTNHIQNGILLRADIHTLFDLNLFRIDENYIIYVDKSIEDNEYRNFDSKYIRLPAGEEFYPSRDALKKRFDNKI